jgi:hypothetical protein
MTDGALWAAVQEVTQGLIDANIDTDELRALQ